MLQSIQNPIKSTCYLLFLLVVLFSASCRSSSGRPDPFQEEPQTYEQKKLSIEQEEQQNPSQFLEAGGNYRTNFLGDKMKVSGYVQSTATVANFKDIVIRVTFYTRTDTEIKSENYTLYEFVNAGKRVNFQWKLAAPSNCEKLGWDVISATPY
jgi:hypothetical protein